MKKIKEFCVPTGERRRGWNGICKFEGFDFWGLKKISEGGKGGSNCCPPGFLAKRVKVIYLVMGALEKAAAK